MALDLSVTSLSKCPTDLWPTTAVHRSLAWIGNSDVWLEGKDQHFVVVCSYGHFNLHLCWNGYFNHTCTGTEFAQPLDALTRRRTTGSRTKGSRRDCGTQEWYNVEMVYDLPPEHVRWLIYNTFLIPQQALLEGSKRVRKKKTEYFVCLHFNRSCHLTNHV
ncbi:hypothetical protein B0H19DRAFT_1056254 [Mycena capillaripes]|nr:hypothetical protein B0H19DRAFT_1056254 [Mycena capillaripes]